MTTPQTAPALTLHSYFLSLVHYGSDLLARLPLEHEPQPLAYALERLVPHLACLQAGEVARLATLDKPPVPRPTGDELGIGLNSVGMLLDRLTILIIKEWCLRHKGGRDEGKARALFETQTLDMVAALCHARPGSSALNTKITALRGDARADSWPEAFYGLLTTNLVLWESQEVLYIRDIGQLPAEELRAYIQWFSYGNMRRNEYIQLCEEFYWDNA